MGPTYNIGTPKNRVKKIIVIKKILGFLKFQKFNFY